MSTAPPDRMKDYTFDIKLWATVRVIARDEEKARKKLADYADCLDIGMTTPDGVRFTEASAEGEEADLIEIDGEAV